MVFRLFKKKQPATQVSLKELDAWLNKASSDSNRVALLTQTRTLLAQLIAQLKEEIAILAAIDLREKQETKRIKLIVLENKERYLSGLKNLIKILEHITSESPPYIERTAGNAIVDFQEKTKVHYERATILIGEEMAATRKSFALFRREVEKLFRKYKRTLAHMQNVHQAKKLYEEFQKMIHLEEELQEQIKQEQQKQEKEVTRKETLRKAIETTRHSSEHQKRNEQLQRQKQLQTQLKQDKSMLSSLIDFKHLAKTFHGIEKDMQLIKHYRERFFDALSADRTQRLLVLLREAKADTSKIRALLQNIFKKEEELESLVIPEDKIHALKEEEKHLEERISRSKEEQQKLEKRKESDEEHKRAVFQKLKKVLQEQDIELKEG